MYVNTTVHLVATDDPPTGKVIGEDDATACVQLKDLWVLSREPRQLRDLASACVTAAELLEAAQVSA